MPTHKLFLGIGAVLLTVSAGLWACSGIARFDTPLQWWSGMVSFLLVFPALSFLIVGAVYGWKARFD